MSGALFAGTVPSKVADIGTRLLELRYCSFHSTSLTSLTSKLLAEPAAVSDVVLNFSFTVDIIFPASGVRSNFKKVFRSGEALTYRVVLAPPAVEAGFALSL